MFTFFRRLQWKLTLSYAAVTAGTVTILTALLAALALLLNSHVPSGQYSSFFWSKTGFQDNLPYLLDDPPALQAWLTRVQAAGFTSADFQASTVRETLDFANTLRRGQPIYVLDPDLNLLASVPAPDPAAIGRPFKARAATGLSLESILAAAQVGDKNYTAQSISYPDGSYLAAFPLRRDDAQPVVAIVIYQLVPKGSLGFATPVNLPLYTTFFALTAALVLAASLPVGAFFGWLVSRGLRRRLTRLATAAQAWSRGDFSAAPRDTSGDEIGELTRALAAMADQLQTLLHTRHELARVEERNRLARDLHDTVKQQTYAARMQLTAARNRLPADPAAAAGHLEAALQLNRETQQELKLIIDELRPAALDGRGLAQALTDYTARWQQHTGIPVELTVRGERPLPLEVEQVLYRVAQESLSNVARHADADAVHLTLEAAPDQVTLTIADEGRGFDPDQVAPSSSGLAGMRQRLGQVRGRLTIDSRPGAGTTLTAGVALAPAAPHEAQA